MAKTNRRRGDRRRRYQGIAVPTNKQVLTALSGQSYHWLMFEEIKGKCPEDSVHSVRGALRKLTRDGLVERQEASRCTTSTATTVQHAWRIKPGKGPEVQKRIS